MKKPYLINKEMSDPKWIYQKQQEFFALKNAFDRFTWGSAYIPVGCHEASLNIGKELGRMDESMKAWQPETPRYLKRPRRDKR